jgi:hypothetical protein
MNSVCRVLCVCALALALAGCEDDNDDARSVGGGKAEDYGVLNPESAALVLVNEQPGKDLVCVLIRDHATGRDWGLPNVPEGRQRVNEIPPGSWDLYFWSWSAGVPCESGVSFGPYAFSVEPGEAMLFIHRETGVSGGP